VTATYGLPFHHNILVALTRRTMLSETSSRRHQPDFLILTGGRRQIHLGHRPFSHPVDGHTGLKGSIRRIKGILSTSTPLAEPLHNIQPDTNYRSPARGGLRPPQASHGCENRINDAIRSSPRFLHSLSRLRTLPWRTSVDRSWQVERAGKAGVQHCAPAVAWHQMPHYRRRSRCPIPEQVAASAARYVTKR
jgi:hypothetical protein